jgi:hypothetical protein
MKNLMCLIRAASRRVQQAQKEMMVKAFHIILGVLALWCMTSCAQNSSQQNNKKGAASVNHGIKLYVDGSSDATYDVLKVTLKSVKSDSTLVIEIKKGEEIQFEILDGSYALTVEGYQAAALVKSTAFCQFASRLKVDPENREFEVQLCDSNSPSASPSPVPSNSAANPGGGVLPPNGTGATGPSQPGTLPAPGARPLPAPNTSCHTKGTGGGNTDREAVSFAAANGLKSAFHLYASLDTSKPIGLVVWLHGDGAYDFSHTADPVRKMAALAKNYNMAFLAVKTPASDVTWWTNPGPNQAFLADLLNKEVFTKYNIDRSRVLLAGYSGGAEFLASDFISGSAASTLCGGGALLFGCGSPPSERSSTPFNANFVTNFKFHFYTGQADEYLSNAKRGSQYFMSKGFAVTTEFPPGINHTSIPFVTIFQNQLSALIKP